MHLLVSVRCRTEVAAAVEGGADIVDAKEPGRGSLGAVSSGVLAEIAGSLPLGVPLSVALGDPRDDEELRRALEALPGGEPGGPRYLKLGFAGVEREATVRVTLESAVARAAALEGQPAVIAVAYADYGLAGSLPPDAIAALAAASGAAGVLLDTWTKDGRDLFAWISPPELRAWAGETKLAGLLAAVAGSLGLGSMRSVVGAEPDIVGVRGAACEGGRLGVVSAARVRAVRAELDEAGECHLSP